MNKHEAYTPSMTPSHARNLKINTSDQPAGRSSTANGGIVMGRKIESPMLNVVRDIRDYGKCQAPNPWPDNGGIKRDNILKQIASHSVTNTNRKKPFDYKEIGGAKRPTIHPSDATVTLVQDLNSSNPNGSKSK